ncbi:MAG: alpha/beta hydrolase [Gammaproteobacteria bacterium]|nr:alpha/beta hydrolase [Gammaproteobacteria bacterium]
MTITKTLTFLSEGAQIAGTLYFPKPHIDRKIPGVALCQGFAGTKEMLLPAYAKKLADNGYLALTFDYRGFGSSEGEPGRLVPKLQVEDIKNAISYLSSLDEIDANRIGLWGTSYGAANAIVATSEDQRVKCLCIQLAFGNGERCITGNMTPEDKNKLKETLLKLQEKKELTGKEMMVPVSKILSDEQSKKFFQEYSDKFPELKTKIPFLTILETMNYKPENYLKNLNVPISIIGAEKDLVNPISETYALYDLALEPKELMVVKDATHFDLYAGDYLEQVTNKQVSWFNKYL